MRIPRRFTLLFLAAATAVVTVFLGLAAREAEEAEQNATFQRLASSRPDEGGARS